MVKKKVDKSVDNIEIKEELKKTKENKKVKKIITKEKNKSKNKEKDTKDITSNKLKSKKRRKLRKSNIIVMLVCMFFIAAGIIGSLYGIGVLTFNLKDPGPNYYDLSEKVSIGDYVDYDADFWEEEKNVPTRDDAFAFGGYKVSTSRNNSVSCNYKSIDNKGWRVFSIEDESVTLIHAGVPMCYYHGYGAGTNDTSVGFLSGVDQNIILQHFLDNKFSETARILSKEDIDKFVGSDSSYARIDNDLIKVGIPYWLSTKNGSYNLWYVTEGGTIATDHVGAYGVRVLVTLKKNVQTTGINESGEWTLVNDVKKGE